MDPMHRDRVAFMRVCSGKFLPGMKVLQPRTGKELKLANAMLSRPRVLMLSQLFDLMAPGKLSRTLSALRQAGTTVILFTGRPGGIELDRWLLMDHMRQQSFPTLHALEQARAASEVDHAV